MFRSLFAFFVLIAASVMSASVESKTKLSVFLNQCASLRASMEDLIDTFDDNYASGKEYLARLGAIENEARSEPAPTVASLDKKLAALRSVALRANPLVSGRPVLFVVRHQYRSHYHAIDTLFHTGEYNVDRGMPHYDLFQGGGAMKVIDFGANGKTRTLVSLPDGVVRDPQVHFDGTKIVFAMRRSVSENYHIWEINVDGTGLRQLTSEAGVCDFDPIYLPDDSIVFSSTRDAKYNMCSRDHAANLFRMECDGANIHQITKNTLFDNHSALLPDGRILYARWEYVDRNFGDAHSLWTVNPDGTRQALFWGNNTTVPGAVFNAHLIPGTGRILCVIGPHHDRLWGALAIIDPNRGLEGRFPVLRTWPPEARDPIRTGGPFDCDLHARTVRIKYEDPWPLSEKYFLCTRMTGDGETTGIYLVDVFGNEVLLHTEGPGCYDPMPIRRTRRPPLPAPHRDFKNRPGVFYVQNVYRGTHMKGVKRGVVKYLRVVESPEKRHWSRGSWNGQGYTAPGMNWHSLENKRILGTVPVASDGSAHFKVPSDTFVYFQLLDENGMMIQSMRSGTVVQSGEVTGCIGCHEGRNEAPLLYKGSGVEALNHPPDKLNGWYGPKRMFSFMREVQPVFNRYCVECHDYGKKAGEKLNLAPDRTLAFNAAYQELWKKGYVKCVGGGPAEIQEAYSWGSHASPLIRELLEPKVEDHKAIRPPKEAFDRLVTWVDLNAVYYPTYACAYPESRTGRTPLNVGQLSYLSQLTSVPFSHFMNYAANPGPLVSFDRPELSPCLAPLKERDDPAYEEAVKLLRAGREMLREKPRADMRGFIPCAVDKAREKKVAVLQMFEAENRRAIREGTKSYDTSKPDVPAVPFPDLPVRGDAAAEGFVLKPPDALPFKPKEAKVRDRLDTPYVWRGNCGNDIAGDHYVFGGWEDPRDSRNYLAYGKARLRGRWRYGIIALAFPDNNCLRARWPLESRARKLKGKRIMFQAGLTDQAVQSTRTGATVTMYVLLPEGPHQLFSRTFSRGDKTILQHEYTMKGSERALVCEVDNCGSEMWSVVFVGVSFR